MTEELPKAYDPTQVEEKWYRFWEDGGFFKADPESDKPPYCIILPPPNVTGVLHMGHALVDTVQDALIRYKRMSGFEALWLPGLDHAGISTQTVVERNLIAKEGKRRTDYTRKEFLKHVWDWKELNESRIVEQLKKVGCSCDWSKKRFTMDEASNKAVRKIFKKMYDQNLIYRGDYLVNWDPVTQTALADDEVEHEERESSLWYIRYPFADGSSEICIATTRPETLLGDVAVAVSASDERYKEHIGKKLLLPLVDREIPIIADHYVDKEFGTGAVKITPAHDFNDYEVGSRNNCEMINIMTPDGHINENGGEFQGLSMLDARAKVVEKLKEKGFLVKVEPHTNRVGVSYRSKAVIEPYLSKQWFVRMEPFKEKLMRLVKDNDIKMVPKHWETTYFHWISNLRDWCISRQLWWGHQIPIWYNKDNPEEMICSSEDSLPEEVQKNPDKWVQDEDVLDTWFSSALWPFSTLGWPDQTKALEKFYPTSVLVTGHDILFFWVARMILMGEFALSEIPFHETFLHGLIYGKSYWRDDKHSGAQYVSQEERINYDLGETPPKDVKSKWEKMSKSKGNVIDPLEIIDLYGADAMRMALLSSLTHARQIDLDRRRFEEFKNFANKLWNSARFVLMNLTQQEDKAALTEEILEKGLDMDLLKLEDKWILSQLNESIRKVEKHLKEYEFDKASQLAYSFFWDKFCAYYVEISKPVLFGKSGDTKERENKQKLLLIVLLSSLRLLHPMTPFITEEIFQRLKEQFSSLKEVSVDPYTNDAICSLLKESCMIAPFPKAHEKHTKQVEEDFALLENALYHVRNIRGDMQLSPGMACDLYFIGESKSTSTIQENTNILSSLVKISNIHFVSDVPKDLKFSSGVKLKDFHIIIPLPEAMKDKEKKRLSSQYEKLQNQLKGLESKLANPSFVERAPEALVQNTKKSLEDAQVQLGEIEKKLEMLKN
ncbi:MAG: Valine--tRNA ligase [Chlamydiia bacterium]|nr:Valine--tRNA ligase [Chlamydiia bacterium]